MRVRPAFVLDRQRDPFAAAFSISKNGILQAQRFGSYEWVAVARCIWGEGPLCAGALVVVSLQRRGGPKQILDHVERTPVADED